MSVRCYLARFPAGRQLSLTGYLAALLCACCLVPGLAGSANALQPSHADALRPADAHVAAPPPAYSLDELREGYSETRFSVEDVVTAYLARIEILDRHTAIPLQSIITLNENALEDARAADRLARSGAALPPLHGVPILVKDNIETRELPTTAGSILLMENSNGRDATVIARLREAGAIILGKTNMSEWSDARSSVSVYGWSAVGGQTRNPHGLDRTPCGSSSGSAVAVAALLSPVALGTDTGGSILCPAAVNGVIGFRPTIGLLPRTHIVPLTNSFDTPGPISRTVKDIALLLDIMAGTDTNDPLTADADARRESYTASLEQGISEMRIGVLGWSRGRNPQIDVLFDEALQHLQDAGAELVMIQRVEQPEFAARAFVYAVQTEAKVELDRYLSTTTQKVQTRSLDQVIEANRSEPREMMLFGQEKFEQTATTKGLEDPDYKQAMFILTEQLARGGMDRLMEQYTLDLLVAPAGSPAFPLDLIHTDYADGANQAGWIPTLARYPGVVVPMGAVYGLPVGILFTAPPWSDATLLRVAYAYEQRSQEIRIPTFRESSLTDPEVASALKPLNQVPRARGQGGNSASQHH